jgi:pimeloyl-ACP methyl ester carboxylesterase
MVIAMKRIIQHYLLLLTFLLSFSSCFAETKHPTMMLIHGALFTSRSWASVQSELHNKGYNVITVDTPGRLSDGVSPEEATLSKAVDKVCRIINLQSAPIILVGHSQAGAIITQATDHCRNKILGLIYIAAVVPKPGEQPFDALSDQDNQHFDRAAPLNKETGLSIPDYNAPIKELFMADAKEEDAKIAINDMVPEPIIFAFNKLNYDIKQFHRIPKYYIKTSQDLIISPDSQDKFISREKMNGVILLQSSHSPFISQPKLLAEKLIEINDLICLSAN